jgi:hypothetical protein
MKLNTRSIEWELESEPFDRMCFPHDSEFESGVYSKKVSRTNRDGNFGSREMFSVRRKIERRNDRKELYSSFDN